MSGEPSNAVAAIIDTNVLVAGISSREAGTPVARIVDAMLAGRLAFVISQALLNEYREVLMRLRLRRLRRLEPNAVDAILVDLAHQAIVIEPAPATSRAPDPGDQPLWNLLAHRPDLVLVTGDATLLGASDMARRVSTPRAFVETSAALR